MPIDWRTIITWIDIKFVMWNDQVAERVKSIICRTDLKVIKGVWW